MRVVVVTPPAPIVTWEEADQQLRLEGDQDQKLLVERFISAATGHIDGPAGWLGRSLGLQTLEAYLPSLGVIGIALPYPPAIDVIAIDYVGVDGAPVEMPGSDYEVRGNMLRPVWPKHWPEVQWQGCGGEPVRIQYRAGYAVDADADPVAFNVPEPIRQAILLMVGDMWHSRASIATGSAMSAVPMSPTVMNLLSPYRVFF